jgi:hypothetical protein
MNDSNAFVQAHITISWSRRVVFCPRIRTTDDRTTRAMANRAQARRSAALRDSK